ncbi:MAG: HipA domain-containing protein [Burkholderiales bacterium]|jgi:serine/threonine-protein kinase HipA
MTRELLVRIDQVQVGTLSENQGIWSFTYTPDWAANGFDLAPGLPRVEGTILDTGTKRPVQWFFDNLLPEEDARDLLVASAKLTSADAWSLLELYGAESAGAITLLPPGVRQPPASLRPLTDEQLQARIKALPRQALTALAPKRMSLAGAQQKLAIVLSRDGRLFEPEGAGASTHILKPDSTSDFYTHSAVNEWFCARVAQETGLPVPTVVLRYVPSTVYIIERFDRKITGDAVERLHVLDATQLLSLAAGMKYGENGLDALTRIVGLCRAKAPARLAIFRWVIFNLLIGNNDAHLKNLSVFAGRDGYSLTPHYDLVSTSAWSTPDRVGARESTWPDVQLSFPIGSATRFSEVALADVIAFANGLGIPQATAHRYLDRMVEAIMPAADAVQAEFEARTDVPVDVRAGQIRMLRSIRHLPISTMVAKLRR